MKNLVLKSLEVSDGNVEVVLTTENGRELDPPVFTSGREGLSPDRVKYRKAKYRPGASKYHNNAVYAGHTPEKEEKIKTKAKEQGNKKLNERKISKALKARSRQ